jgi:hypothetical protein
MMVVALRLGRHELPVCKSTRWAPPYADGLIHRISPGRAVGIDASSQVIMELAEHHGVLENSVIAISVRSFTAMLRHYRI